MTAVSNYDEYIIVFATNAQVEFSGQFDLAHGKIYAIANFDLYVIVKYLHASPTTEMCSCSPVVCPSFSYL